MTCQTTEESIKTFNIQQFPFTRVGYEIASLKEGCATDDDFIALAKEINKNAQITIGVHRLIKVDTNQIEYDDLNLLEESAQK